MKTSYSPTPELLKSLEEFFTGLNDMQSEKFEELIDSKVGDDILDLMTEHLEEFYGIEDDEELASLCQIMVTGYLAGRIHQN
jgi:hypothetical protein